MLLYEIADNVYWLMLTDVEHIKKNVLCAQGSFVRSLMLPMSKADLSLYTWYHRNDTEIIISLYYFVYANIYLIIKQYLKICCERKFI